MQHIIGTERTLTARQREVLALIGEGRTTKEIARALLLSVETVGNHRKQICRKLDVHSTAELVAYASRVTLASL
jgi:two-component system, NarL family, response regulator NreC